jgi:hypothetical protein
MALTTQHTTKARDLYPCHQRDWNPRSQQSGGFWLCFRPHGHWNLRRRHSILLAELSLNKTHIFLLSVSNDRCGKCYCFRWAYRSSEILILSKQFWLWFTTALWQTLVNGYWPKHRHHISEHRNSIQLCHGCHYTPLETLWTSEYN